MSRSLFISFEGIDGSGKSTQCEMLNDFLIEQGYTVHLFREPGGTIISEKIRDILLDKKHMEMNPTAEMLLYFASRNQLITEQVIPALDRGEIVLLDRFVDSTLAYQGYGRALDLGDIKKIAEVAIGNVMPELTVLVDTPLDLAAGRMNERELDRLEAENNAFKQRTREGYLSLARSEPHRFLVLDGRQSIEALQDSIRQRVVTMLAE